MSVIFKHETELGGGIVWEVFVLPQTGDGNVWRGNFQGGNVLESLTITRELSFCMMITLVESR
jgi:hypothetical protein